MQKINELEIDDVAQVIADVINAAIAPLLKRIAELEAREIKAGIEWAGVYQRHVTYRACQLATCNGSLWLAQRDTEDLPGSPESGWRLVVKEGAYRERER